jgi:hypothetical protein
MQAHTSLHDLGLVAAVVLEVDVAQREHRGHEAEDVLLLLRAAGCDRQEK